MVIECTDFCRALSDDTRQEILVMLSEKEMCVADIVDAFRISQPTVSHHLNILRQLGLINRRKDGKQVFYSVNRDNVVECCGRLIAKFDAQEACGNR